MPSTIKLSLGGGIKQTNDDSTTREWTDKSQFNIVTSMSDDINQVTTNQDFTTTSYKSSNGFFFGQISFYNYSNQTIILKNVTVRLTFRSLWSNRRGGNGGVGNRYF